MAGTLLADRAYDRRVSSAFAAIIVAHQGGWDEALMIGVPIVAIGALLWLAKRRVDRQL